MNKLNKHSLNAFLIVLILSLSAKSQSVSIIKSKKSIIKGINEVKNRAESKVSKEDLELYSYISNLPKIFKSIALRDFLDNKITTILNENKSNNLKIREIERLFSFPQSSLEFKTLIINYLNSDFKKILSNKSLTEKEIEYLINFLIKEKSKTLKEELITSKNKLNKIRDINFFNFNLIKNNFKNEKNLNFENYKGSLFYAVKFNQINIAKMLISLRYSDVNEQVLNEQKTPLIEAIYNQNLDLVKLLVNNGANVNLYHNVGNGKITPLMAASLSGKKDIVEFLISNGASSKNDNCNLFTPVDLASTPSIKELLLNLKNREELMLSSSGSISRLINVLKSFKKQ